jgi:hypothetical protein
MPSEGFKPAIPASGRPQVHATDRATTDTDLSDFTTYNIEHGFVLDRVTIYFQWFQEIKISDRG